MTDFDPSLFEHLATYKVLAEQPPGFGLRQSAAALISYHNPVVPEALMIAFTATGPVRAPRSPQVMPIHLKEVLQLSRISVKTIKI
jgi:ABC-type uncharacterized transport system permease subunit